MVYIAVSSTQGYNQEQDCQWKNNCIIIFSSITNPLAWLAKTQKYLVMIEPTLYSQDCNITLRACARSKVIGCVVVVVVVNTKIAKILF